MSETAAHRPLILAIDDQPANLMMLGAALSKEFDLQAATSGEAGLRLAAELPPDLILLDVMMPGMDGYEVCRRLKSDSRLKDVPVVFVTALDHADVELEGLALGAADYITKPINVAIARQRIHNLLEREQLRRELEQQRDMLEQRVAERTQALSLARKAAEAANVAKSAFLSNMSHEIRTPLNAIVGMTYLLRKSGVTPRQADYLDKSEAAARHLIDIINAILDLSKIEAGKLAIEETPVNPQIVVANVVSMVAQRASEKELELATEIGPLPSSLIGDHTRLQQALLNYAINAVKFTENGTVTLRVRLESESGTAALLRFEVEDTGIGIDADTVARLFTDFEQADNSTTRQHGGTGLGLSITRRLATLMGGSAGVESFPSKGSTFWFTAQLKKEAHVGDSETAPASSENLSDEKVLQRDCRGRKILLTEDEEFNREIMIDMLHGAGFEVDVAMDGIEAVERVGRQRYDLILMDVQMPRLDGVEATRRIRMLPNGVNVPILATTANAFTEDRQRCLDAGMNDFIGKPIRPEVLYATLLKWCREFLNCPML